MSLINEALKKSKNEASRPVVRYESGLPGGEVRVGNPAGGLVFKTIKSVVGFVIVACFAGAIIAFLMDVIRGNNTTDAQKVSEVAVTLTGKSMTGEQTERKELRIAQEPAEIDLSQIHSVAQPVVTSKTPQNGSLATDQVAGVSLENPTQASMIKDDAKTLSPKASELSEQESGRAALSESPTTQQMTPEMSLSHVSEFGMPPQAPEPIAKPRISARQPVVTGNATAEQADEPMPVLDMTAEANSEVVTFLEEAEIAGIRAAGRNSRLLMNNQVYKVGSIVEPSSKLRITQILDNEIHFVDGSGALYRKQFRR